jgi:hypothetical protein
MYNGSSSYNWCENAGCPNTKKSTINIGLIVGLSVGGIVILSIVIVIVVWIKKRNSKKESLME